MKELRLNRDCVIQENPPFPKNLLMELTNACNHNCIFCANVKRTRKITKVNKEVAFKIMEEAYRLGTREIGFYMSGEPFLCNELVDYVKKASSVGGGGFDYIYITTNGVLAKAERVKELVDNGLSSLKFSINAATRETYKMIHGKDDFDIVLKNVREIYEAKKRGEFDIPLFISCIKNKYNYQEEERLREVFGAFVDKIYFFDVVNMGGIVHEINEMLVPGRKDTYVGRSMPCEMLFNRIHVNSDGYLVACCVDVNHKMAVVDLSKVSLEEAWNCEELVALRRQHMTGEIGNNLCFNCLYNVEKPEAMPLNASLCNNN